MEDYKRKMIDELVRRTGLPEKKCLTFLDRAEWTEKVYDIPFIKSKLKPEESKDVQESLWDEDEDTVSEEKKQDILGKMSKTADFSLGKVQEKDKKSLEKVQRDSKVKSYKASQKPSRKRIGATVSPKEEKPVIAKETTDTESKDPQDGVTYIKNASMAEIMMWVKTHCKPWRPPEYNALDKYNRIHGTGFRSWEELSLESDLSDSEIDEYFCYISWYHYLKTHDPRNFPKKIQKRLGDRLDMSVMGLDILEREY